MKSGRSDDELPYLYIEIYDPELAYIQITIAAADDGKALDHEKANGANYGPAKIRWKIRTYKG